MLSYAGSQARAMTEKAVSMIIHVHSIWVLPLLLIYLFSTMWYFTLKN